MSEREVTRQMVDESPTEDVEQDTDLETEEVEEDQPEETPGED